MTMVWNPAAVDWFFRAPLGPVGLDMAARAGRVLVAARAQVGVGKPDPLGRVSPRQPGQLRDSLVAEPMPGIEGPAVRVGSTDPIALLHHQGTRPHVILPKRQGGRLLFYSEAAQGPIFARQVNHPGTAGNPYLTKPLLLAVI